MQPRLYADWRVWLKKARGTGEAADDRFFETCMAAFPADSIESALPVWVFPIDEEQSYSNLGQGNHFRMLATLDAAFRQDTLFHLELIRLKDNILEDILDNNRAYWQAQPKILHELDQIIGARFVCLSDRDYLALKARRNMFNAPEANQLKLNLRSGL